MSKEDWEKLSKLLYTQASDSLYRYHTDAYMVLNALAVVTHEMGRKTKEELLCEAAEAASQSR